MPERVRAEAGLGLRGLGMGASAPLLTGHPTCVGLPVLRAGQSTAPADTSHSDHTVPGVPAAHLDQQGAGAKCQHSPEPGRRD